MICTGTRFIKVGCIRAGDKLNIRNAAQSDFDLICREQFGMEWRWEGSRCHCCRCYGGGVVACGAIQDGRGSG